ncbi:MAG: diguanylate cyclase [Zetaproteobacteria bacterium]|nr:diguanylate cyclase [Zetaproteobacteria bacterium]
MVEKNFNLERKIIAIVSIGFAFATLLFGFYYQYSEQNQLDLLLTKQARQIVNQVQITRHWNAEHGGVYVMLRPGETVNPYLYQMGPEKAGKSSIEPEIIDQQGRHFALINPALMTREIAEGSALYSDTRFHLTSLKLINPHNAPDTFEKASLLAFEKEGAKERILYIEHDDKPYFRYMVPLRVESSCIQCHGFQGYKLGDVRGGLSVTIPMHEELEVFHKTRMMGMGAILFIYALLMALMAWAIQRFVGKPLQKLRYALAHIGLDDFDRNNMPTSNDEIGSLTRTMLESNQIIRSQYDAMDQKSRVDPLTGVNNRYHLYLKAPDIYDQSTKNRLSTCTMMLDLDHFKHINDTFGHTIGDQVLKHIVMIMSEHIRQHDLFVRYGGEEFLIILPQTNLSQGQAMAERIRYQIEHMPFVCSMGETIKVTVSIGIYCSFEDQMDRSILCADKAMYQAKEGGRNQVLVYQER